jgi:putative membrane protein
MRMAVALIAFGFAIVQFFDLLKQMPGTAPALAPEAPKHFGLTLIFSGVLTLVISIWQYWWLVGYLRSGSFACVAGVEGREQRFVALQTPAVAVAIVLIVIGVSAAAAVLLRLA